MLTEAPAPDPPRTDKSPELAKAPTGVIATDEPFCTANVPALAERLASAPSIATLFESAMIACGPNSDKVAPAAMLWKLPLPNSMSAAPLRLIEPFRVVGAPPAMLSLPGAPVWPTILIEPEFASACAFTVTGAVEPPNGALP